MKHALHERVQCSIMFTSPHFGELNVRSCIDYPVSLTSNVDLFTLALENMYVNTSAWKKYGGLIYILFPCVFYAHVVSTYTDVKERLTGDSCATPRCDEVGWA